MTRAAAFWGGRTQPPKVARFFVLMRSIEAAALRKGGPGVVRAANVS